MGRSRYEELVAKHDWATPSTFNFATDVVDRWAKQDDREALIWANAAGERGSLSFSEVSELSSRFAAALKANGIVQGDRVVVMLPRTPEWMVVMVGCLRAGVVPVPCIEMLTARDLTYRVTDSEAAAIICRSAHVGKFSDLPAQAAPVRMAVGGAEGWLNYADALSSAVLPCEAAVVRAEDPAIMYYTSGSTGGPKGVLHAARALHAWRYSAIYWLDLTPADTIWCTADTGWSKAGTSILFGPWSCGARVLLFDGPYDPRSRLAELVRNDVTVYCAPGTELSRVADEAAGIPGLRIRRTVSAGEAVTPAIAARWEAATGVRVDEAYGQTEALMLALNYPGDPVKYGSMGRPEPGCDLAVVDHDGVRVPAGEEGDLALLTPNPQLMLGYWKAPDKTDACFRPGPEGRWYVTGDRATVDEQGYLWYRGRSDDVINSAGYRIGPNEIENVLMEHPAVQACAVVGSPDAERGEIVKAFVVLRPGHQAGDALVSALQAHAKALTAPYKYPRAIAFVPELPLTATGKIRRRDLRNLEKAPAAGHAESDAPVDRH